jgi:molybdate/tungstate transport system ATP-binding protein
MIDAKVRKRFKEFSLDAEVHEGGFISILGRNGSGKSTFLKIIAGLSTPDEGYVRLFGKDITKRPVEERYVVLVTPSSYIPHLEVSEHLRWGRKIRGSAPADDLVAKTSSELGIDFRGRVSTLSMGMRERVALATAYLASPKAILVDEAFANLHDRRDFISSYRRVTHDAGIDVIFTTQDEEDSSLGEHSYTIADGQTQKRS